MFVMTQKSFFFSIFIILAIGIIDSGMKYTALHFLPDEHASGLSSIFALALHKNPGVTFDLVVPHALLIPITSGIIIALFYLFLKHRNERSLLTIGAFSVICGATSNLIDRIINGFTTDYFMVLQTSIFNLSDVLILFGGIVILVYYKNNPHSRQT